MPVLGALRTEAPRPRIVREHPHAGWLAATTVCAGTFLGRCDAGAVVFSLPALRRHFDVSPVVVQWVSLGHLLTLAAVAAPMTRVASALGPKLTWTYGFVVVAAYERLARPLKAGYAIRSRIDLANGPGSRR